MHGSIRPSRAIALLLGTAVFVAASCVASSPTPTANPAPSAAAAAAITATPSQPASVTTVCAPAQLKGRITMWTGAAGSRIANISLTNTGESCLLSEGLKPQLLDGHGAVLVDGTVVGAAATMRKGATLTSLVDVSNYCGPAPVAPVSIGLVLTGRTRVTLTPPSPSDVTVPPCNGPSAPSHMEMHPWA